MTKARDLANSAAAFAAVSATELGYIDGVTSAIQTQIDGKQAINANVSTTELGYLDGVTSAIQTQIDAKLATATASSTYIPNTLTTTTGDIIYASAANTPARRAIGSTGNVLTVAGGVPTWAAPAGGGKVLQVVQGTTSTTVSIISTSFTDSGLTATITPSSASSRIMVVISQAANVSRSDSSNWHTYRLVRDSTPIWNNDTTNRRNLAGFGIYNISYQNMRQMYCGSYVDSPATTSAVTYKTQWANHTTANSASVDCQSESGESSLILLEIGA